MSEKALTHKDLSVLLGVSETTIKSYRRKFPGSIPVANKGKPIRFKPEAAKICLRIRDLFGQGMSVEEVGARLTQDFGWRRPRAAAQVAQAAQSSRKSGGAVSADLSQSFATALGNMAKSMISLNQSHTGILKTLKRVETLLGELGLGDVNLDAEAVLQARLKNEVAAAEAFEGISKAMDQVSATLEAAGAALEESRRLREEQKLENATLLQGMENIMQNLAALQAGSGPGQQGGAKLAEAAAEAPSRPKVLHLHGAPSANPPGNQPGSQAAAPVHSAQPTQPEAPDSPRRLLQLPLVVRLENGNYVSAGGKSLGKISLNDVKAMLAQAHQPPENFQLRWEQDAEGLWAVLDQPGLAAGSGRLLRLQMREVVSAKGLEVLEIAAYLDNGASAHPVEFYRFLNEALS